MIIFYEARKYNKECKNTKSSPIYRRRLNPLSKISTFWGKTVRDPGSKNTFIVKFAQKTKKYIDSVGRLIYIWLTKTIKAEERIMVSMKDISKSCSMHWKEKEQISPSAICTDMTTGPEKRYTGPAGRSWADRTRLRSTWNTAPLLCINRCQERSFGMNTA